jgi:hypothetical protein
LIALGVLAGGCMSSQQLASRIGQSMSPEVLPAAVGCWEREFEAAGFHGEYVAVVDFTVESSGEIRDVKVQAVEPTARDGAPKTEEPTTSFSACLERALASSSIAASGWTPDSATEVLGFRIALTDASAEARRAAEQNSPNMLIGPRADHCLGLYSHHPPLDAARLTTDLAAARAAAKAAPADKRDEVARALQKVYDLALELRKRLALDASSEEGSGASQSRTQQALREAESVAEETGALIGCKDFPWSSR